LRTREVPPVPTYREAMESSYVLMQEAARDLPMAREALLAARNRCRDMGLRPVHDDDPGYQGSRYISLATPATADAQKATVKALWAADQAYQRAEDSKKHWERYWLDYHDFITAHPELADTQLSLTKEWLPQRRARKS